MSFVQAGTTRERLVQAVAATADANGLISFNLGPAPLGFVWQGSVTVTNAPSGALFTASVASTPWGQWAGPTNFGPVQLWGNETLVVAGVGLQRLTQYSMLFFGVSMPETLAVPLPPVAPTSIVNVETSTLLFGPQVVSAPAGSATVQIRPPSLTRRLTIIVRGQSNDFHINQVTGDQTGANYYTPNTLGIGGSTYPDLNFFAIEPAADQTYTILFNATTGTKAGTVAVLASTSNPYVTNENAFAPLQVNAGLVQVAGSPVGTVRNAVAVGMVAGTNNNVLVAAPGAGLSIYVLALQANVFGGAATFANIKTAGIIIAGLVLAAANDWKGIAFPGTFACPANTALVADCGAGAACTAFALYTTGPAI